MGTTSLQKPTISVSRVRLVQFEYPACDRGRHGAEVGERDLSRRHRSEAGKIRMVSRRLRQDGRTDAIDANPAGQLNGSQLAAEAGIAARTFFCYFKTKEEILQHFQGSGFFEMLRPTLLKVSADQEPLDAVRDCLLSLVSRYETEQSLVVDRLFHSTEALHKKKQLIFSDMEAIRLEALYEVWPQLERRKALQVVAMASAGAMRLGMDEWHEDNGAHPLADYIHQRLQLLRIKS